MKIRIFIESTWKGPQKKDGVAEWLVECRDGGKELTQKGFIHLQSGTQTEATLMGLINSLVVIRWLVEKKGQAESPVKLYTRCGGVVGAASMNWPQKWKENGWKNSSGDPVKRFDLWEKYLELLGDLKVDASATKHEYRSLLETACAREYREWQQALERERGHQISIQEALAFPTE